MTSCGAREAIRCATRVRRARRRRDADLAIPSRCRCPCTLARQWCLSLGGRAVISRKWSGAGLWRRPWVWSVVLVVIAAGVVAVGGWGRGGAIRPTRAAAASVVRPALRVDPATTELHRLIAANAALFSGSAKGRVVALTFDDGPGPYTARIVATLRRLKAPATFFEIGSQIARYRRLVANMVKFGFVIGDHTWSHPNLESLPNGRVALQVAWTKNLITKVSGEHVQFIRPPYGAQNARIRTDVGRLGLLAVLWNIDTRDWTRPGTQQIIRSALAVRPGGIIIMHDGGGPRSQTHAALPGIIRELRARRFRLVTLPQLLAIAPPARPNH